MCKNRKIPILNIGQFGRKLTANDFYSNTFKEHSKTNKNVIYKPHSHNFYLCVLFTDGSGIHEIDFNRYKIKPGSLLFFKTWANTSLKI